MDRCRSRRSCRFRLSQAHAAEHLEPRVLLTAFIVTNTNNSGDGTLRQAILDANAIPGADLIRFAIPGPGPHVISPAPTGADVQTAAMPITDAVDIDGFSQPGSSANTLALGNNAVVRIRLDGASAPAGLAGLFIDAASGVSISGMSVTRFEDGVIIRGGAGGNTVAGNFIGLDPAGNPAANRGYGVSIEGSPANTVGGADPADRNVVSSNGGIGVRLTRSASVDNIIAGNYIGTDPAGTLPRPNGGAGVAVTAFAVADGYASRTTIGGLGPGSGNVISGNAQNGVLLLGPTNQFNAVQGNKIGTNAAGTAALGNGFFGVLISFPAIGTNASSNNTIGGIIPAARNIISGNGRAGVAIFGPGASGNAVQGNYIGTDVTGSYAISNLNDGVRLGDTSFGAGPSDHTIGGSLPGAGNLISGNIDNGVELSGAATTNNLVAGNLIGTDRAGAVAVFNTRGVLVDAAPANRVGGAGAGARNIISGSETVGVRIQGATAVENRIQGNYIGTTPDGVSAIGNLGAGILVTDGASRNVIGAPVGSFDEGEGNVIAFSGNDGVAVLGGARNTIRLNSIHTNAQIGIDLDGEEQTLNDATDSDDGPNGLQNWPEIVQFSLQGLLPRVTGYFAGRPGIPYALDFYANDGTSRTNLGEGARYLSTETLTPDLDGYVQFNYTIPLSFPLGKFLTVTATDPEGNTSEFSHDADTDGLLDHWETGAGIDGNGDKVPDYYLASPDPLHKDVYVEVDAMPTYFTAGAGQSVTFAFANFPPALSVLNPDGKVGITLHYELDPVAVPQQAVTNFEQLRAVKLQEFGTPQEKLLPNLLAAKRMTHRYAVFAPSDPNAGGRGWIWGHEFYLSISPGNTLNLAAVFMHELGHSISLRHGGVDHVNYKPNYHSVMNYMWSYRSAVPSQLPPNTPARAFANSWKLDYSERVFPTLDKNRLDEQAGIGGHAGDVTKVGPWPMVIVPESGPVDWNRDGDFNDVVTTSVDINQDQSGVAGAGTVLGGYDDWSNLILNFRHSAEYLREFGRGNGAPAPAATFEDEPEDDLPPDVIDALDDVGFANGAPRVRGLLAQIVNEGDLVAFTAPATDPEGDPLTFALAPGAPAGANIDRSTGRFTWQTTEADGYGEYVVVVRVTDAGSLRTRESGYGIVVRGLDDAVVARHVFSNRSARDGNDPAATAADDNAIDRSTRALLPGQAATAANFTTYFHGINGVMVDIVSLPPGATLTADDFDLHAWNGTVWAPAPAPGVSIRPGAGAAGSDRVTLILPDGAVRNTWLRVTVRSNPNIGLTAPDVFYYGNLVGDTDGFGGPAAPVVNIVDLARTRANVGTTNPDAINRYDFNHDAVVSAADVLLVRANLRRSLSLFTALTPPPAGDTGRSGVHDLTSAPTARTLTRPTRRTVWDLLEFDRSAPQS
jgi:hypothetical protein